MPHHAFCVVMFAAFSSTFLHGCGGGGGGDETKPATGGETTVTTTATTTTTTTTTTPNPRGKALCEGELMELYHQTDMTACKAILESGFDMGRATPGNQGMGTYFADEAYVTGYKTRHMGCVIKVLARVGNVFDMEDSWLPDMQ